MRAISYYTYYLFMYLPHSNQIVSLTDKHHFSLYAAITTHSYRYLE